MRRRVPIRKRLLRVMLFTTVGALVVATVISIICMSQLAAKSENALSEQLKSNVLDFVENRTQMADARFEHYISYIEFVSDYIGEMYEDKAELIKTGHEFDFPRDTTPKGEYAMQMALNKNEISLSDVKDDILFSAISKRRGNQSFKIMRD